MRPGPGVSGLGQETNEIWCWERKGTWKEAAWPCQEWDFCLKREYWHCWPLERSHRAILNQGPQWSFVRNFKVSKCKVVGHSTNLLFQLPDRIASKFSDQLKIKILGISLFQKRSLHIWDILQQWVLWIISQYLTQKECLTLEGCWTWNDICHCLYWGQAEAKTCKIWERKQQIWGTGAVYSLTSGMTWPFLTPYTPFSKGKRSKGSNFSKNNTFFKKEDIAQKRYLLFGKGDNPYSSFLKGWCLS